MEQGRGRVDQYGIRGPVPIQLLGFGLSGSYSGRLQDLDGGQTAVERTAELTM